MKTIPTDFVRRVLMTTDTVGGVWNYALELSRALAEEGIEVMLATMGALPSDEQRRDAWKIPCLSLCESRYALEWMDNPWEDVARASEWLWQLEQDFQPDVVHLNNFAQGALPWNAPVVMVGHSCVLSWWQAVKGELAPPQWARYAEVVRQGLHSANQVVAPSSWMAEELVRLYQLERAPSVIPNGRDPSLYTEDAKEPYILSVGRLWDEAKNIRLLCNVAADLPWPVKIAGSVRSPDGRVNPLGPVEQLGVLSEESVRGLMSKASIYAMPARYEPFGLSILEAALSGCALILGDIPSLREIWGDAALYIAPDDPSQLRSACLRLIADAPLRAEMARRARARAEGYRSDRMATAYMNIYGELIEARRNAAAHTQ